MATETIVVAPDQLGAALDADLARHIEIQRRDLERRVTYIQEQMVAQAPRDSGAFAASVRPYRGSPGATWKRGGGGSDAGAAEVEAVLREWKPGEEVGVATDAPYSRKLIFHAGDKAGQTFKRTNRRRKIKAGAARKTYTKKVAAGWVDKIVKEANALAPEGG